MSLCLRGARRLSVSRVWRTKCHLAPRVQPVSPSQENPDPQGLTGTRRIRTSGQHPQGNGQKEGLKDCAAQRNRISHHYTDTLTLQPPATRRSSFIGVDYQEFPDCCIQIPGCCGASLGSCTLREAGQQSGVLEESREELNYQRSTLGGPRRSE
ncbi:unnamed protein product [Gadus morhua 'NCC']